VTGMEPKRSNATTTRGPRAVASLGLVATLGALAAALWGSGSSTGILLLFWTFWAVVGVLVFFRRRQMRLPGFANLITAAGLWPFVAYSVLTIPFDVVGSGMIELDDRGYVDLLAYLSILGICALGAFAAVVGAPLIAKSSGSKRNVLLSGVQLGMIIVLLVGLVRFQATCVMEDNGSDATCGLPIRPGVVVPTPTPGSKAGPAVSLAQREMPHRRGRQLAVEGVY
jgi:hypothetical protein